jgi:hypothetical protein
LVMDDEVAEAEPDHEPEHEREAAFQVLRSVPATPGFPVQPFTAKPSGCPFVLSRDWTSGTKRPSGADAHFPKDTASVSDYSGPEPFLF